MFDANRKVNFAVARGRVAIVTGAATGIGCAIATSLAEQGAWVGLCDVNETAGRRLDETLQQQGLRTIFVPTDVLDWQQQKAAFAKVSHWAGQPGRVEIVVANAGLLSVHEEAFTTAKDYQTLFDLPPPALNILNTNLIGTYYTACIAFWHFQNQAPGDPNFVPQLLFMGSLKSFEAFPLESQYCAAKFGIRAIWKTLRRPVAGMPNFQTNLLAPSFVDTEAVAKQYHTNPKSSNFAIVDVKDVADAAMRCICDGDVQGRAVTMAPPAAGQRHGSANFDLQDDMMTMSGGLVLKEKALAGAFGTIPDI